MHTESAVPQEVTADRATLVKAIEDLSDCVALSQHVLGVKLLARKKRELEMIRDRYLKLDAAFPGVAVLLARLQGRERQIREDVALLENAKEERIRVERSLSLLDAESAASELARVKR